MYQEDHKLNNRGMIQVFAMVKSYLDIFSDKNRKITDSIIWFEKGFLEKIWNEHLRNNSNQK